MDRKGRRMYAAEGRSMPVFGCIADDFTGAGDAASFLAKGGLSVQLFNGISSGDGEKSPGGDPQAVVIALKSRTAPKEEAVRDSLAAAEHLLASGVKQIYFKYCSTFDSTPEGNIGPVADALMERMGASCSVLCPSLPVNGRTVRSGCLYVNGVPLDETHMKDHPLTPMRDHDLGRLMDPQSRFASVRLSREELKRLAEEGRTPCTGSGKPCYFIPDYETDEDGTLIAEVFGKMPFLTGGSGLLAHLAARLGEENGGSRVPPDHTSGRAVLFAGSCSAATLRQIECYRAAGHPCVRIDPERVLDGTQTCEELWSFIKERTSEHESVLLYSSDTPENVRRIQRYGAEKVSEALEGLMAALAVRAAGEGFRRIISAGGETSGAITAALGFSAFWIGGDIAPGVPVMIPVSSPDIRVVLKSGNFGQEDFFARALSMTAGPAFDL